MRPLPWLGEAEKDVRSSNIKGIETNCRYLDKPRKMQSKCRMLSHSSARLPQDKTGLPRQQEKNSKPGAS
jgi:hypothetical protein